MNTLRIADVGSFINILNSFHETEANDNNDVDNNSSFYVEELHYVAAAEDETGSSASNA